MLHTRETGEVLQTIALEPMVGHITALYVQRNPAKLGILRAPVATDAAFS